MKKKQKRTIYESIAYLYDLNNAMKELHFNDEFTDAIYEVLTYALEQYNKENFNTRNNNGTEN